MTMEVSVSGSVVAVRAGGGKWWQLESLLGLWPMRSHPVISPRSHNRSTSPSLSWVPMPFVGKTC